MAAVTSLAKSLSTVSYRNNTGPCLQNSQEVLCIFLILPGACGFSVHGAVRKLL